MTDTHLTSTRFDSLALDPRILAGLAEAGFTHCTPIQAETLPIALQGQDIAGQAQTGTGKTAAFLVALMQRLLHEPPETVPESAAVSETTPVSADDAPETGSLEPAAALEAESAPEPLPAPTAPARRRRGPRALVLAPTRELAVQIHKDTLSLAKHTGLRSTVVYGGTGYQQQRDELARGVDILIGTPGRLIDYYKQHVFDLKRIEVVVLDEADRMFDLGFIKDIRYLFRQMPPVEQRLGMLFSATLSYRVTELAYEHMNHPRLVKIETEQVTADRVRQVCYMTANEEKIPLLLGLIRGWPDGRIIVFVNTKREADRVWGYLQGNGIDTAVLSGDVPQPKRLKLLRDFTNGTLPVLVGTDVAARGLHIPDVTHVVNYDLPEDPEDYVHRIGRTARAGAAGDAVSFVCETYAFCLLDIEQYIGAKVPVEPVDPARLAEVDPRSRIRPDRADREERRDGRGGRGGRERGEGRGVHGRSSERDGASGRDRRPGRERPERRSEVSTGADETAVSREPFESNAVIETVAVSPETPAVAPAARSEPVAPASTDAPSSAPAPRQDRPVSNTPTRLRTLDESFLDQLVDEWPERTGPELEIPDMPIIRRIKRARGQLEPAALTSPPVKPREPVEKSSAKVRPAEAPRPAGANAELASEAPPAKTDAESAEAKSGKRRRRRRKPTGEGRSVQTETETVSDQAPETVD
ncbi:DEAD/DEAH box helicase [Allochromatium humboldtianum]|uniref:ATP-dependent RNA helicase RhlB n=1 Tax=Allochromatium humboldtianum TaxID=504901 RepID=A0A850RJ09_9GAMM|nr:DEAD/DEAH box helicase [Allochromatium humboldtianum]NVZ11082.1 DEAD/DEAH box helicase [Allochromatium humboldtianum]